MPAGDQASRPGRQIAGGGSWPFALAASASRFSFAIWSSVVVWRSAMRDQWRIAGWSAGSLARVVSGVNAASGAPPHDVSMTPTGTGSRSRMRLTKK